MIRRALTLLGCGVALLSAAACATFETDTAATVDGTDISIDGVERAGDQLSGAEGVRPDFIDRYGDASASAHRTVLSLMIDNQISAELLADRGRPLTQDDIEAAAQTLRDQGSGSILDAGSDIANAIATNAAVSAALGDLDVPSDEQIAAVYPTAPASLGVICANQVVVDDKAYANDVVRRLAAGEPAADVAEAVDSTATAELIGRSGAACPDLAELAGAMPPAIYDALLHAKPGVPLGPFPITGTDGAPMWVVLQVQDLNDAADDLTTALGANPGPLSYLGASATADVWVASDFGAWDAATRSVVPLATGTA